MVASFLVLLALAATSSNTEAEVGRCIAQASVGFKVDPIALELIRDVEGGQSGSASRNDNGTVDLGVMQVNSWWLPRLEALLREHKGVVADVARAMGRSRKQVYRWVVQQGLDVAKFRG